MEGSFADAANNHGFKRSRWRRLVNQKIQDYLIAAIQNIRILVKHVKQRPFAVIANISELYLTFLEYFEKFSTNFKNNIFLGKIYYINKLKIKFLI